MKIFKTALLISFSLFLTACYDISNEIQDMRAVHQAFVNDLEDPIIGNADEFYRTYDFDYENGELYYEVYISELQDCISFLKFNLNENNIFWNKINISRFDAWNNLKFEKTLFQEKFKFYQPEKYCQAGLTFKLYLNKNNSDLEHIKNIYQREADARMLADKEVREVSYIMELYNMFMQNRDVVIREESIGGREIHVEYRNDRNQLKQDRIRLFIEYNDVSKKFCSDVLDVMVSNIKNRSYNGTSINGLKWESISLNGENLTIDYRYNNENVCHSSNSLKFVLYNEFDE